MVSPTVWAGFSEGSSAVWTNIVLSSELPPPLPGGSIDLRLTPEYAADPTFQGTRYDIRGIESKMTESWFIEVDRPSAGEDVNLDWSRLPFQGSFELVYFYYILLVFLF